MLENLKGKITQTKVVDLEKEVVGSLPTLLYGILFVTAFLVLVLGGWYLASKNSLKNLNERVAAVDTQLVALKDLDQQMATFTGAVANLQSALEQKKKWSLLFNELNRITPKDATYSSFSADEKGTVIVSGVVPSLGSLARVVVAFKNSSGFSGVTLSDVSMQNNAVQFTLNGKVAPAIFKEAK